MLTLNVYPHIVEGYKIDGDEHAIEMIGDMLAYTGDEETTEQNIRFAKHLRTVDGIGVYYNYGADHYFYTKEG